MGSSTKTVGGGAAKPLANEWNQFLQNGLNSGVYGSTANNNPQPNMPKAIENIFGKQFGGGTGGLNQSMNNGPMAGVNQTQGLAGGINNMLNGGRVSNPNEMTSELAALRGLQLNPANAPGANAMQNFAGVNFQQAPAQQNLGFNPLQGMGAQPGQVGYNPSMNPQQLLAGMGSQFGGDASGINNLAGQLANNANNLPIDRANLQALQSMLSGGGQALTAQQFQTGGADLGGQTAQAIQQIAQRSLDKNVADLRARYGASGGASFGTPAAVAEATMRAEAIPQMMMALGQLNQTEAGLQNQNNALNLQSILGTAGANQGNASSVLSALGLNQQADIARGQLQNQGASSALSAMLGVRDQDLNAWAQSRGMDINQLSAFANAAQNQDQLGIQAQMANQTAGLQGRSLDLQQMQQLMQNQLGNRGIDADFASNLNNLMMQQRGQDINSFLQQTGMNNQLAELGVNTQLQNNQQLMNLLGMRMSGAQAVDQFGQQNAAMQNQNMMNMINQLFSAYGQSNALGTPQAQIVQQPSAFGQAMGAIGGVLGMVPGLQALGGVFGGMGQTPVLQTASPVQPGGGVGGYMPPGSM